MAKKNDPRLAAILDRSGDAATVAWAHDGQGTLAGLADPELAVLAAEKLGNVAALQAVSAPKELKKAAGAALHRLKSAGVKVDDAPKPASFTLGAAELDLPSRAFLSVPDRDGEVELLLTASDQEGSCVLAIIIGGPDLIREARHAHLGRGELRNLWSEVTRRGMHVELPFTSGLHYAERLLAPRGHHDWKHFLEHVSAPTLQSARILDPLARIPAPAAIEPTPPKWMFPHGLLEMKALESAAGSLLTEMTQQVDDNAARDAIIEESMRSAADAALTPAARGRLDQYLELVIAASKHRGWATHAAELTDIRASVAAGTAGRDLDPVLAATRLYVAQRVLSAASEFGQGGDGFEAE